MKKWIAVGLAVVVVAAAGYWYANRGGQEAGPTYETIEVSRGDVEEMVSGSGTVQPTSTMVVRVTAPGTVTAVSAVEGQPIAAGAELFHVDGRPVYALLTDTPFYRVLASGDDGDDVLALQEFLTDLGYYDGDLDAEYGGGTQEAVRDFLDERELERTSRVGPETFQSVGSADLGTPVTASVGLKTGDPAQPGMTALVIRPAGALDVVVSINEVDIPKVATGQPTTVTLDALPGQSFTGVVTEVSPGLLETDGGAGVAPSGGGGVAGVVSFPVTVRLESPSADIKPGMSADADIILSTATDVLAVPTGAVQEKDGVTFVLVPGAALPDGSEGDPQPVEVTVGLRSDDLVEITAGLSEGQTIVIGLDVDSLELPSTGLFGPPDGTPGSSDTTESGS
ncbi:MAG: efflux RND transporter periplasmic adaptor subunit [Thermoleophilia bacterium]